MHIAHFELDVVKTCNNRCVNCSHFAPVNKPKAMTEYELYEDCITLAHIAHADRLFLLGGEPTLHPDLAGMAKAARQSGLADEIVVLTNGAKLDEQPPAFWNSVDTVDFSQYGDKPGPTEHTREMCVRFNVRLIVNHRTVFHRLLTRANRTEEEAAETLRGCPFARECYMIDYGWLYICPSASYIPALLMGLDPHIDGLEIATATEESLAAYLGNRTQLNACKRCTYKPDGPWRELAPGENWLEASMQ